MKKSICMLIVSAILIAGVFLAGCTQGSGSTSPQSSVSQVTSPDQSDQPAITRDRPAFNQSAAPNGTLPSGFMMNGTPPSGPPPDGVMRNRTPLSGMMMNGTPPSGSPPEGMMRNRTPRSGL